VRSRVARSEWPASPRVWLQVEQLSGEHFGYAVMETDGGRARPGGLFLFSKGHQIGAFDSADMALDDSRLRGTLSGKVNGEAVSLALDACVLGNRFAFGTVRLTKGGGAVVEGRVRGGVCDSNGPQIRGCTDEQMKLVKELQATLVRPDGAKAQ
jgi:hypothetical protein